MLTYLELFRITGGYKNTLKMIVLFLKYTFIYSKTFSKF